MRESRELPRAQVSGEKQNSFTAGERALEVLETFIDNGFADVLAGVLGEEADLGNLASEGGENPTQDLFPLATALLRKRQLQIAHAHAAQFSMKKKDNPGNCDSGGAGQRPGQGANQFQQDPGQRVFESIAQGKGDGSTREILLSNPQAKSATDLHGSKP